MLGSQLSTGRKREGDHRNLVGHVRDDGWGITRAVGVKARNTGG